MSSTAFIEPLPVIDFVTQLLNRDVSSRPLSDADRVKVRFCSFVFILIVFFFSFHILGILIFPALFLLFLYPGCFFFVPKLVCLMSFVFYDKSAFILAIIVLTCLFMAVKDTC